MPTLLKCEKHHYIEKKYTELYANLITATQLLNENPVDFALRCIDLREKFLLSSKIPGEIEYDAHLSQKMFFFSNNLVAQGRCLQLVKN